MVRRRSGAAGCRKMVRLMSEKTRMGVLSRRAVLRSALSAGAAALAAPALAQSAMDDIINAPRRGNWDDQFDAKVSRATVNVTTNTPILNPQAPASIQQAIGQYQSIVANGGWPTVPQTAKPLQLGAVDSSVQALRQRLIVSGDLSRDAGVSSSFDSYVDGAV